MKGARSAFCSPLRNPRRLDRVEIVRLRACLQCQPVLEAALLLDVLRPATILELLLDRDIQIEVERIRIFADLLAEPVRDLPAVEADDVPEQELVGLTVLAKAS